MGNKSKFVTIKICECLKPDQDVAPKEREFEALKYPLKSCYSIFDLNSSGSVELSIIRPTKKE